MRRNCFHIATVLAFCAAGATHAFGQVNPPSWWNVNDGNTSDFGWTFGTPAFPPTPDYSLAPFGQPTWNGLAAMAWLPSVTDHQGVYGVQPGGYGELIVSLPNHADSSKIKQVWMQVDYYEDNATGSDVTLFVDSDPGVSLINYNEVDDPLLAGWQRATITFDLVPQPSFESFRFVMKGGQDFAAIDNLYIGTHCVPEPVSLAALALGLIPVIRRRRNRG